MALNLGHAVRDAVDGPSLDELVGEDPADIDLPALSARIRRRRRTRATAFSAVGIAAVGAIALVGTYGGLDRRGVEMSAGSQAAPFTGPPLAQPMAPLSAFQLSEVQAQLCGRDVSTMPTVDSSRLVPWDVATTVNGGDLGTLAGRTLTAAVVADGATAASAHGQIVLTTAGAVVAVGAPQPDPGNSLFEVLTTGQATGISPVAVRLTPCPSPSGTPDGVAAGTYQVQYLVATSGTDASGATARSAAGPWSVTLLDQPPATTALPTGFPTREVPVVGGTLLAAGSCADAPDGWTVQVAVAGDDAITRAADALAAAGAGVGAPSAPVNRCDAQGGSSDTDIAALQATLDAQQRTLASTQAQRLQAFADLGAAQRARDAAAASGADSTATENARLEVAQRQADLSSLDASLQAQLEAMASQRDLIAAAAAQQGETTSSYRANIVGNGAGSYTVLGPKQFTAVTASWTVRVEESTEAGQTVLTYSVLPR